MHTLAQRSAVQRPTGASWTQLPSKARGPIPISSFATRPTLCTRAGFPRSAWIDPLTLAPPWAHPLALVFAFFIVTLVLRLWRRINSVRFFSRRPLTTTESWCTTATAIYYRPQPHLVLGQKPFPGDYDSTIQCVALTPDGGVGVTGSSDPCHIRLWELDTGRELMFSEAKDEHLSTVTCLAISPDSSRIVSGSWDKTIRVWNAQTGELQQLWTEYESAVGGVAYFPDGRRVASGHWDHTVCIWDAVAREGTPLPLAPVSGYQPYLSPTRRPPPPNKSPRDILLRTMLGHSGPVSAVAVDHSGALVASGSWDGSLIIWDIEAVRPRIKLLGHAGKVFAATFTPDGQRVVSAGEDRTVRIWDVASGTCLHRLDGHGGAVKALAVSADGEWVISGGDDCAIRIWDAKAGAQLQVIVGHRSPIHALAISRDRRRLISSGGDKAVFVWDAAAFAREELPLPGDQPLALADSRETASSAANVELEHLPRTES